MYAQTDTIAPVSGPSATRPTRATLQTRPRIQRALIRSWEYIPAVRISILIGRLLVVPWLLFLGAALTAAGTGWGLTLLPAAVAVFAIALWVFNTAKKGWPVAEV
jgi:hydrogenase-4 membrane subunit HyfE